MSMVMTGNYILVEPGKKAFKVASNFTNYLELGARGTTSYYLEARIQNDEFLINATLLTPHGRSAARIVNNFPEQPDCRKEMTPHGYRIIDNSGGLLLGIESRRNVCILRGTVYDSNGQIVAQDKGDDFLVYRGPAILGKSPGGSLGIVLE